MCSVLLSPGVNPIAVNKYIISYRIMSCHIVSHRIISYIISYHVMSYRIASYHIIYHIVSCHVVSYRIVSYISYIISYHVISYHIISYTISYSVHFPFSVFSNRRYTVGRDGIVGIGTCCELVASRIEFRWGVTSSPPSRPLWGPHTQLYYGYRVSFSGV